MRHHKDVLKEKSGQLKIATVVVFLLLIPLVIGVTYTSNETPNITGNIVATNNSLGTVTTTASIQTKTSTSTTQSIATSTSLKTNTMLNTNNTFVENETSNTTNQNSENITKTSTTITAVTNYEENISVENSTNTTTTTSSSTTTIHPTVTTTTTPIPEQKPRIEVKLDIPEKITRGEKIKITANATNVGNKKTKVTLKWDLPEGFYSEVTEKNCGKIGPDSSCISEITVETSLSTDIGKKDIGVEVIYD